MLPTRNTYLCRCTITDPSKPPSLFTRSLKKNVEEPLEVSPSLVLLTPLDTTGGYGDHGIAGPQHETPVRRACGRHAKTTTDVIPGRWTPVTLRNQQHKIMTP